MRLWGLFTGVCFFSAVAGIYPAYGINFGDDLTELFDPEDEYVSEPAPKPQPQVKKEVKAPEEVKVPEEVKAPEPKKEEVKAPETTKVPEAIQKEPQEESLVNKIFGTGKKKVDEVKQKVQQVTNPKKKVHKKRKGPQVDLLTKVSKNMPFTPNEMRAWIANTPDINACFENGQTMLLMFVARYTDVRSLNLLIDNGADLQTHCTPRYEALLVAVSSNPSAAIIETLLNNGANLVDYDYENNTALMLAAAFNPSASVLNVLIDYGLKVNTVNKLGFNALMLAAYENGHVPVLQTLLDNEADVNAKDPFGHTALMAAALRGREDVIRYLIFRGADYKAVDNDGLNVLDYYHKRHYLHTLAYDKPKFKSPSEQMAWEFKFVAQNHHRYNEALKEAIYAENAYQEVSLALQNLADVDTLDDKGCTMLLAAVKNGNDFSVIEKLVKSRANVSATCHNGQNALMMLAEHSDTEESAKENAEKAWLLIENGLDINATDNSGSTAMIYAIHNQADNHFIQMLIEAGADLNKVNKYGESAAWILVKEERALDTLAILLQNGADANQKNKDGLSPLWYQLLSSRNDEVMKVLLAGGADSNELNVDGEQPLWYAFSHAVSADVINGIIAGQEDLNIKNDEGDTPLLFAVKHEYPASVIKFMLAKGADPNVPDAMGNTVYDIIKNNQYFEETHQRIVRDKVLEAW